MKKVTETPIGTPLTQGLSYRSACEYTTWVKNTRNTEFCCQNSKLHQLLHLLTDFYQRSYSQDRFVLSSVCLSTIF